MRLPKLTLIIVSIVSLAVITLTVIQFRSVGAQQEKAQVVIVPEEPPPGGGGQGGGGIAPAPAAETTNQSNTDMYLDADVIEAQAVAEQTQTETASSTATLINQTAISFKNVPIPLPGGIDHAVAGVGTRNSGQGVMRLRGVPPGSTLMFALLVWGEISTAAQVLNPYNVRFGPNCTVCSTGGAIVPGTPLVFPLNPAQEPFWNANGQFWAYMANVTNQISPGINGDYQVRGLRSAIINNRCPWGDGPGCADPGNALILSEGASLIVVYSNPCIPRGAQLYFNLGPRTFFGPLTEIHNTLPPIRANLPNLKHSRIGGDGQIGNSNCGLRSIAGASDERTWIENLNPALCSIQIKGDGAGLQRDSDWNGDDGEPLNKLWDTHTDVFSNSNCLAAGGGLGYRVRYTASLDAVVWVVHILGVR
jgi:hypothetical protein